LASAPFGIEMGSPVSTVTVVREMAQGKYYITPPKPHPQFETYLVQASPTYGIVWIKGITSDLLNDSYGNSALAMMDKLRAQLESRYGPGNKTDFLMPDALWTDPRDWAMGLLEGERAHHCLWQRPENRDLPDDLASIFLGIGALDNTTTNVVLEYASTSLEAAERELDNEAARLL